MERMEMEPAAPGVVPVHGSCRSLDFKGCILSSWSDGHRRPQAGSLFSSRRKGSMDDFGQILWKSIVARVSSMRLGTIVHGAVIRARLEEATWNEGPSAQRTNCK